MTTPEMQGLGRTSSAAQGCVLAAVIAAVVTSAAVACLHFAFDAFLVEDGADCDGCRYRERSCAGVLVEKNMRDGERTRCVGIPVGPWRCYRVARPTYVREPCSP